MFAVALVMLCLHGTGATEYAHTSVTPVAGEIVPMDIELHNKSMLTYPGTPDPPIACFKKTINFHDFSKGLVAMKFVGKNVCFVKTSDETYEEIVKVIDRIKKGDNAPKSIATEEWVTPRTQVPTEEVARRVGSKIANFCSGCKVYVLQDGKVIRTAADVPRVTRRGRDDSPSSLSNHRRRSCGWLAVCFGCSVGSREKEESHSGADQPVGLNRQPSSE